MSLAEVLLGEDGTLAGDCAEEECSEAELLEEDCRDELSPDGDCWLLETGTDDSELWSELSAAGSESEDADEGSLLLEADLEGIEASAESEVVSLSEFVAASS